MKYIQTYDDFLNEDNFFQRLFRRKKKKKIIKKDAEEKTLDIQKEITYDTENKDDIRTEIFGNKYIFVDLDHTLIEPASGGTFSEDKNDWILKSNCIAYLKIMVKKNYKIIIVTNQGGIESGYVNEDDFKYKMNKIKKSLAAKGIPLLDYFYSITTKRTDPMRKPNIGAITKTIEKYGKIDKANSRIIGDKSTDRDFAKAAELRYLNIKFI